ncbi:UDP-glucuronic acid decarboxylase family protein [Methanobrevibacter sp.]|uniref:UDP-glucuronic acid decarboxylase family protein n=1 Tax=Methanobrevibacter sp. TaxID=66852 RepID=UPI0025E350D4|nr:UDP-glucuronic acid decarboxylase family protein [Methanobrevibacter sp.]MBQ2961591.1 SDR family oxidoreductase [Methanobrevibacter sp.]
MKTILVCGGAGFLGSNLCSYLVNKGERVICADNFSTGNMNNLKDLDSSLFSIIEHDITEPLRIDESIDEIYNLASIASPPLYLERPIYTFKTNVLGALNLLELANEKDARILQTSTSEVYGEPLEHPQRETYRGNVNPIGVRACYDEGKRAAETLFFDFNRTYSTKIKVVRIFNAYGPNMEPYDGRVVSNFIIQSLKGEDITVYGDGKQTRSFCYVDDMIEGLYRMMNSREELLGPVNLGNPNEFTILDLAQKIIEKTNSESELVFCPLPTDDPTQRKPDISLAKSELDWEPKIELDEGLDKTIEYYSNLLNI